jgi:hypothetical protein
MNLPRLAKKLSTLQRQLGEVGEELQAIRGEVDPFARHVFQARHDWRQVVKNRRGKSHRDIDAVEMATWHRAKELGFQGDFIHWRKILEAAQ